MCHRHSRAALPRLVGGGPGRWRKGQKSPAVRATRALLISFRLIPIPAPWRTYHTSGPPSMEVSFLFTFLLFYIPAMLCDPLRRILSSVTNRDCQATRQSEQIRQNRKNSQSCVSGLPKGCQHYLYLGAYIRHGQVALHFTRQRANYLRLKDSRNHFWR